MARRFANTLKKILGFENLRKGLRLKAQASSDHHSSADEKFDQFTDGSQAWSSRELFSPLAKLEISKSAAVKDIVFAHRKRFMAPVQQPLVLISQIQRSGGTLISQLLDGHSQLHVHPSELHIGTPNKYYWPKLDLALPAKTLFESLQEGLALKHAASGYQKLSNAILRRSRGDNADVLPFMFIGELQGHIFEKLLEQKPPITQRDVLDAYATSYFNAWLDYSGLYRAPKAVKYWVAFAARLLSEPGHLGQYLADYPDGRVLVPIRNPVSWFASARRHSTEYDDPEQACSLWLKSQQVLLAGHERHESLLMFVEHEKVVSETKTAMRAVANFLGIRFERVMLTPTFNKMTVASDSSFEAKYGVDITSQDRSVEISAEIKNYIRQRTDSTYHVLKTISEKQSATYGRCG